MYGPETKGYEYKALAYDSVEAPLRLVLGYLRDSWPTISNRAEIEIEDMSNPVGTLYAIQAETEGGQTAVVIELLSPKPEPPGTFVTVRLFGPKESTWKQFIRQGNWDRKARSMVESIKGGIES